VLTAGSERLALPGVEIVARRVGPRSDGSEDGGPRIGRAPTDATGVATLTPPRAEHEVFIATRTSPGHDSA